MYICIILSNTLTACLSKYAGIGVWINYYFTKCWKKMNKNFKIWFVVVSEEWGNREDCLKIYCLRKTKHFHLSSSSKLQKACYIVYLPLSLDKVLSPATEGCCPSFEQNWILYTRMCCAAKFDWNWPVILENIFFNPLTNVHHCTSISLI